MSEVITDNTQVILNYEQENEQLKARVAELEDAIEFATAPDMWVETGDNNVYEYKYFDWYVNVLSEALEKTAKQSLVELQVNEAEKISSIVQECAHNPNRQYMANLVVDDDLTALDIYKAAIIDSMKAIFDYQSQLQAEGE
jgi:hypothetical protein